MNTELTVSKKKANFIQRLFRKEDGAETLQAVMLVAIGAIVACTVFGFYLGIKSWTQDQKDELVGTSASTSEL